MKAYSNDLRHKIVAAYERGHRSQREIAELFGVSPATVRNFARRKRERGSPDQLPRGGGATARIDSEAHNELRQLNRLLTRRHARRSASAPRTQGRRPSWS